MKQGFENVKTPLPTGCENRRGKPLIFLFSTDFPVLFFQSGKLKNASILFPGLFGCSSNEICKLPLIFKILFPVFSQKNFIKKQKKGLYHKEKILFSHFPQHLLRLRIISIIGSILLCRFAKKKENDSTNDGCKPDLKGID